MKKIILIPFLIVGFLITSCTDLELNPNSEAVPSVVFTSPDSYRSFIAKVYAGLAVTGQQGPAGSPDIQGIDEGFSSYTRMLFYAQEFPTETAHVGWNDQTIQDFAFHTWDANDVFLNGLYSRLFYQITIANEFIRETEEGLLDERGITGPVRDEIRAYRAEARFLRALSYWHALDLFRNVPFFTQESGVGAEPPSQGTPEEVFDFIETELLTIENELLPPRQNEYGRADRGAAWMLLAKLYLNSEVYTGKERYADCLVQCEKIINSGAYQLSEDFQLNFLADNHTSPEIIFPVTQDGDRTQTFGGTTFLVHAAIGGDMLAADWGVNFGWGGIRTTRNFVELFPDATGELDSRAIFFTEGQNIDVTVANVGDFRNGYAMPKFSNIDSQGNPGSDDTFPDTDFPMFRYADAYLMYAEAALRSGGDLATATEYVNRVRRRAYGGMAGDITQADLTLDFLLDERGRELAWECHRRTDRVRFGQFTEQGTWQLKGREDEGTPTASFRNIYPLPSNEIIANPKLTQNPNY
jgi:hypothetical protein